MNKTRSRLILNLILSLALFIIMAILSNNYSDYMENTGSSTLDLLYPLLYMIGLIVSILYAAYYWVLLPWHIARVRNHHNKTAILVTSLVGVITFGIAWLVALIWAFTNKAQGA